MGSQRGSAYLAERCRAKLRCVQGGGEWLRCLTNFNVIARLQMGTRLRVASSCLDCLVVELPGSAA